MPRSSWQDEYIRTTNFLLKKGFAKRQKSTELNKLLKSVPAYEVSVQEQKHSGSSNQAYGSRYVQLTKNNKPFVENVSAFLKETLPKLPSKDDICYFMKIIVDNEKYTARCTQSTLKVEIKTEVSAELAKIRAREEEQAREEEEDKKKTQEESQIQENLANLDLGLDSDEEW